MKKYNALNKFKKGILLFTTILVLIFTVVYAKTINTVGIEYNNVILSPLIENGQTIYSGRVQGEDVSLTVSKDKEVLLKYKDLIYGPYTLKEDPTALPSNKKDAEFMTGLELYLKDEMILRGGYFEKGDTRYLYQEDGSILSDYSIIANGVEYDEGGNLIDPMEPSLLTIASLILNPNLTHKGDWSFWFLGVFLYIILILTMFFADELFRWTLSFRVRDVELIEPTAWEITARYINWILIPFIMLIIFIIGVQ